MLWKWSDFLKGKKISEEIFKAYLDEFINTSRISVFRLQKGIAGGQSPLRQNVEGLFKAIAYFRKVLWKVHTQPIIDLMI